MATWLNTLVDPRGIPKSDITEKLGSLIPKSRILAPKEGGLFKGEPDTYVVQLLSDTTAESVQNIIRRAFSAQGLDENHVKAGFLQADGRTFVSNNDLPRGIKGTDLFVDLKTDSEAKIAAISSAATEIATAVNPTRKFP